MNAEKLRDFLKEVDEFVFFHLGSDASVEHSETADRIEVRVEHDRVLPFQAGFSEEQVVELAGSPAAFEEHWLELLTRYRRS